MPKTEIISGRYYRFADPDSEWNLDCSSKYGWQYIQYTEPDDLLLGNLWIIHTDVYYHKMEVFADGSLNFYGQPVGTIDDLVLQEV